MVTVNTVEEIDKDEVSLKSVKTWDEEERLESWRCLCLECGDVSLVELSAENESRERESEDCNE